MKIFALFTLGVFSTNIPLRVNEQDANNFLSKSLGYVSERFREKLETFRNILNVSI